MDKFAKAVLIMKGLIALVKGDYRLVLGREGILVVDPRMELGDDDAPIAMLAGISTYREERSGRPWTSMLLSVLENMGPVLEDDKRDGKTTAESRRADDPALPDCGNPNCPIHGKKKDLPGPVHGWIMPEVPEA